jgi:hypothetical protein
MSKTFEGSSKHRNRAIHRLSPPYPPNHGGSVENSRLEVGHTFPDKDLLKLRVAKEAHHCGIHFYVPRSEVHQYKAYGEKFAVKANNNETANSFYVSVCSVHDGDDFTSLDGKANSNSEKGKTPFTTAMIVPLVLKVVAMDPAVTNKSLRSFLEQYRKPAFMTDASIQEACTQACMELFGTPSTNVKYVESVMNELKAQGHIVHMKFTTRRETLKNIERLVIWEELLRRKYLDNSVLNANECKVFGNKWKNNHPKLIIEKLGRKGDCAQYLHRIYSTPSFAQQTVPELKRLFMADACHVNFGKYTLFSCYGITANGNMSPVGFVIAFRNENGSTWNEFWNFVKDIHPLLNLPDVTIVTDQDKGQKSAITTIMNKTGHFHCAHHRRGNIIKMCGSKSGTHVYLACGYTII